MCSRPNTPLSCNSKYAFSLSHTHTPLINPPLPLGLPLCRSLTHPPTHPLLPLAGPFPHAPAATHWPEYLAYNLETDDEEKMLEIKNAAVPYNTVGLLEVR